MPVRVLPASSTICPFSTLTAPSPPNFVDCQLLSSLPSKSDCHSPPCAACAIGELGIAVNATKYAIKMIIRLIMALVGLLTARRAPPRSLSLGGVAPRSGRRFCYDSHQVGHP